MRNQVLAAAAMATALTAFAQPAAAQRHGTYHDAHVASQEQCARSRSNRTAGGAVIGGVIGALLGREIADRGVRGEGAGVGAVVGAVAGGAVGRSTARCDSVDQRAYDPNTGRAYARNDGYYNGDDRYARNDDYYRGGDDRYSRDDEDLYGGPYQESGYYGRSEDRNCRVTEATYRDSRGRRRTEEVYMCRGRDGVWRRA